MDHHDNDDNIINKPGTNNVFIFIQ